jgi:hypothetical protein
LFYHTYVRVFAAKGPFAASSAQPEKKKKDDSLPLVEPLAYHDLFHGATVASL